MILNESKCHFLIAGPETAVQQMHLSVGEEVIWESSHEKLLGVLFDKLLKFHEHVLDICKKASSKLSALTRFARVMSFIKKKNPNARVHSGTIFILPTPMDVLL